MSNQLITPEEAARMKSVSAAAIYAAVRENRLPHTRVLRRIGLRKTDVMRWEPRSYGNRIGARSGRAKGTAMKAETKARISESQKRRWAERKAPSE